MDSFRKAKSSDVFAAVSWNQGRAVCKPKVDVTVSCWVTKTETTSVEKARQEHV